MGQFSYVFIPHTMKGYENNRLSGAAIAFLDDDKREIVSHRHM
jgi:hypothetical protein